MRIILVFLGLKLLAAHSTASKAGHIRKTKPDTHNAQDTTQEYTFPTLDHRDTSCTASHFYGADEPSDMCGPTTFSSLTSNHCTIGDASLVDDCNELIADLQGLNGGGFWGMVQQGTLVIASHGACNFHIERKNKEHEFAIGTQDMIDTIASSIAMPGVVRECKGQKVMAVTGVMSCEYKGTTVDTIWWIEGPYGYGICG
ncbi:hypothetical protein VMCG_03199 [Cytospora schulzeri]|uniref:Ecp2 effector protein-like domain-containing protein n=1 Tax=Cytospora schulzeri TaxID=448051 RepID=A0A423WXP4_9PEZI|nr:hypothetical protein VMCG_03199 [Valsa malicola]